MDNASSAYKSCLSASRAQFDDGAMEVGQLVQMADAACLNESVQLLKAADWFYPDAQLLVGEERTAYLQNRYAEAQATLVTIRQLEARRIRYYREDGSDLAYLFNAADDMAGESN